MICADRSQRFLDDVKQAIARETAPYAFSGDTARCLWILAKVPGASVDLWRKICHRWPKQITQVGGSNEDHSRIALECRPAMLNTCVQTVLPGFPDPVPLVRPAFVLAQLMTESDPLKVVRVAELLRCIRPDEDVDLEEVRSLLKAVRAGHLYESLLQVVQVV